MRARALMFTLLAATALAGFATAGAGAQQALDYSIPNGWFYTQANGKAGEGGTGFGITDADGVPFWSEYRKFGGPAALGYPISRRFMWDGYVVQATQKVVLQWRPAEDYVAFVNVFDKMTDGGKDPWLRTVRSVPNPIVLDEKGKQFDEIKRGRLALLDANPAIKAAYNGVRGDPITLNGLPTSAVEDFGNVFVLRAQRVVFQHWKIDVPWAKAGTVQIANGGDVGKEAELYPALAIVPEPAGGAPGTPIPQGAAASPTTGPSATPVPGASATPTRPAAPPPAGGASPYPRQVDAQWKLQPSYLQEVPGAEWIIVKLHQLTACENPGLGIGFFTTLAANGQPVSGVTVRADGGSVVVDHVTGDKGPGRIEAYIYRGNWSAWVADGTSDKAMNMNTVLFDDINDPKDRAHVFCDGARRNSPSHYSYEVIWRKRS